ncbi:hypothetical protein [Mesorhizobium sp. 10J20-29]
MSTMPSKSIATFAACLLLVATPAQTEKVSNLFGVELPFELPDWASNPTEAFDPFLSEVISGLHVLQTMGFEVTILKLEMIPPSASLRVSSRLSDEPTVDISGLVTDDSSWVLKAMVLSAEKAKNVQGLVKLEYVALDMQLGLAQAPVMKMSLSEEREAVIDSQMALEASSCISAR